MKPASRLHRRLPENRKVRELGAAGARFYDAVLAECCGCLVQIVHELPQFRGRATADVLDRLSGAGAQLGEILSRLPLRTLDAPEGSENDEEFRQRYLEHISTTLDALELLGVRLDFAPRTKVSVSYTGLTVSAEGDPKGTLTRWRDRIGDTATPVAAWREERNAAEAAGMEVEAALSRSRLTLVRGEAGGGKSTLLKWLAVTAARSDFSGDLTGLNGHVPFLVKLRSHFSPLMAQASLRVLVLDRCRHFTNLACMPFLNELAALHVPGIEFTGGLAGLLDLVPKVSDLNLSGCSWVDDLSPLESRELHTLWLRGCSSVSNLRPLEHSKLVGLLLDEASISDLSSLENLRRLEYLSIEGCHRVQDLTPLARLGRLRLLHIQGIGPGVDLAAVAGNRRLDVYVYEDQEVRNGELLGRRLIRVPRPDLDPAD